MRCRRALAALLCGILVTIGAAAPSAAQPGPGAARAGDSAAVARVRAELQSLVADANAALRRRDRAALERLFAEEYVWAHAAGYVNDRSTHLSEELSVDPVVPLRPSFDPPAQLLLYGDVAVLRTPFRSDGAVAPGRTALNTWLFARRDGRWRIVQTQGTLLQPERTPAAVPAERLAAYAGRYGEGGRVTALVQQEGAGLVVRRVSASVPPRALTPASDSTFHDKLGNEYLFQRGGDGRVTRLVVRRPLGRESQWERMP